MTEHSAVVYPDRPEEVQSGIRMRWPVIAYRQGQSIEGSMKIIGESSVTSLMTDHFETGIIPGSLPGDGVLTR